MIIDLPEGASGVLLDDLARQLGVSVVFDEGKTVNSRRYGGKVARFNHVRLQPQYGSDRYRAYSDGGVSEVDYTTRLIGRRKNAVCWHAHRDWMRAIYQVHPDAVIASGLAIYVGSASFEREHQETHPKILGEGRVYLAEVCRCEDDEEN